MGFQQVSRKTYLAGGFVVEHTVVAEDILAQQTGQDFGVDGKLYSHLAGSSSSVLGSDLESY